MSAGASVRWQFWCRWMAQHDPQALNDYLLEHFPKFWLPDHYVVVDAIPEDRRG